jgi:RNA-binding protein 39
MHLPHCLYRRRERSRSPRRHRDRSSDRSHRRRSRSRSGSRARRDKDREPRDKEREAPREAPRELSEDDRKLRILEEENERDKRKQQKEIDDLTKDQRTVFVSQLTMKTNERSIEDYFGLIGKVNNVIMIRDKVSGKHKGFCYVEMADLESIPMCLQLSGIVPDFQKFPVLVKASEAEKNFLAKKEGSGIGLSTSAVDVRSNGSDCKMYIGNLHVNLAEHDLQSVLSRFGVIESINLQRDELGHSKGYAFVRYMKPEECAAAMSQLTGMELAGRVLKIGHVNDHSASAGAAPVANVANGGGGSGGLGNWKLDDDEGTGMQMNSQSRSMLMAKLGAAAGMAPPPPAAPSPYGPGVSAQVVIPPVGGLPSTCIMIKNMFSLEEETEPDWESEIKEEVVEECSKSGKITHSYVENKVPGGFVYLRFAAMEAAADAARTLNGRFFAGKMITVSFMNPSEYQAKFA